MVEISILNQRIDDEDGVYRVRFGDKVGYITIATDVFDDYTLCRPWLLIPRLPEFPTEEWTRMFITRPSAEESIKVTTTNDPLPEITTLWHPERIDVLSLERTTRFKSNVDEVIYQGAPAVAKIATFEWQVPALERETWAYMLLEEEQQQQQQKKQFHNSADSPPASLSPRVLGHLTECGRVVGNLLEKLPGRFASIADLPQCEAVLRRLHEDIGLVHGDANRYNFLIDDDGQQSGRGVVRMVDFEHATPFEEVAAREEMASLVAELSEETGRGCPELYLLERVVERVVE